MRMSRTLVLNAVLVLGLLGALAPVSAAAQDADGTGVVVIDGTSQTDGTDQSNDQVQIQAPDQSQTVDQVNLQISEQANGVANVSSAEVDADGPNAVIGDTNASSSTGDSNLSNSNPQISTNQSGQSQAVVGGNQTNAPGNTNVQTTDVVISDVGGDVDTSTNVTVENVGNDSGNVDESMTITGDLLALLALLDGPDEPEPEPADCTADPAPNVNFSGCDFPGGIVLDFASTDLSGADFSGITSSTGSYFNFGNSNLTGADLSGANLPGASFFQANLTDADLSGANLTGANFYLANLTGADMTGANMTGVLRDQNVIWNDTICPNGINSDDNGGTCVGTW